MRKKRTINHFNEVGPIDKDGIRAIHNPENNGLRFVGYSDTITTTIRHTGWYLDDLQDETVRGCVYALPARDGKRLLVAGYRFNYSWDDEEVVCIDFSILHECEYEAAHYADRNAEIVGEKSREYHEGYNAGSNVVDLKHELSMDRKRFLKLRKEHKEATLTPELDKTIIGELRSIISNRCSILKEIDRIMADRLTFSNCYMNGFNEGIGT